MPEAPEAEQARVLQAFRRLAENPDFQVFCEILRKRQRAEGEHRVNELLRAEDARLTTDTAPPGDIALFVRRIAYWRGYADGLYFSAMIVDRYVQSSELPKPKEATGNGHATQQPGR